MAAPVIVRPAVHSDIPCIAATWLNSYKRAPMAARIPPEVYRVGERRIIQRLLDRSEAFIAHPEGEPDLIIGYLVLQGKALHYCYVKPPFRRMGVATALLKGREVQRFSHLTIDLLRFFKVKLGNPVFDPYLAE